MFELFKNIFNPGPGADFPALLQQGAQIVDVRTREEFRDGHIQGSLNIPVQNLHNRLSEIRRDKPVITCCASGMRSASAKRILEQGGFPEVHNGGGWRALKNRIL